MFVRVFDKHRQKYYKSMVYAAAGAGWCLKYIVLNPDTHTFELVEGFDQSVVPKRPLVDIIQSDQTDFVVYQGSSLLKYKHFCKVNGFQCADISQMMGYPDVLEHYAFLADILTNKSVSVDAYQISIRGLSDATEWNYILTQTDADDFMQTFAGFHDSTLESVNYSELSASTRANVIFNNSGWFGIVELCFEGVQMLKIVPATGDHFREIFDASLLIEDESVFWADSHMENPEDSYEGSIIKALNLKWRKL